MDRLTYKSFLGDYGLDFNVNEFEICEIISKLANRLGPYEDLDMTPDEIRNLIKEVNSNNFDGMFS